MSALSNSLANQSDFYIEVEETMGAIRRRLWDYLNSNDDGVAKWDIQKNAPDYSSMVPKI